ncbi:MAG: DNA translocase FtsK [Clostridiales bacterium]|nr:DNA translocase FtsK [Clostridiales bacterium]
MARKRKSNKSKKINKKRREAIAVSLIGLGIFILFSIYTEATGIVGHYFFRISMGLLGVLTYIMPLLVVGIGVLLIISNYKKVNRSKIIFSIISLLFILCIIHLLSFDYYDSSNMIEFIKSSYINGMQSKGTGALLSPIIYILFKLLGLLGSYIFLIVAIIINFIVLLNLSFKNVVTYVSEKVEDKTRNTKKKAKKKFEGAVIDFESSNDGPDIRLLGDNSFDKMPDNMEAEYVKESRETTAAKIKKEKLDENMPDEVKNIELGAITPSVGYDLPPISLLNRARYNKKADNNIDKHIKDNAKLLEETLHNFGVNAKVTQVSKGPVITRYELQPAPGVKVSKIVNLADDISLNLAAPGIRIEAPIPGKAAVGIEVPNDNIKPVYLRQIIDSVEFQENKSNLSFALGKDIAGKNIIADLAKMPHLLIAGATGSGKSVCINTIITSLLYKVSPEDVRLILIDPKVVELNNYNGIPHLLFPVVTDPQKAAGALNWVVQEMVNRYKLFADTSVRNLEQYNEAIVGADENRLPQIVVIIDELSDLMMVASKDVEDSICRLAQMARAAGIHLIIATQRPSVDVITGLIKVNIPSRIAFAVSSGVDSRTILDMNGAEKLLGRGDMLYYPVGFHKPIRVQGAYVSEKEVGEIVKHIKAQEVEAEYDEQAIEKIENMDKQYSGNDDVDELFDEAVEIVIDAGQASISMLQRRLRIGYARAARLIDEMEVRGFISGFEGSKPRDVFITKEEFEENYVDA